MEVFDILKDVTFVETRLVRQCMMRCDVFGSSDEDGVVCYVMCVTRNHFISILLRRRRRRFVPDNAVTDLSVLQRACCIKARQHHTVIYYWFLYVIDIYIPNHSLHCTDLRSRL